MEVPNHDTNAQATKGQRMRARRDELGLSRRVVAAKLGVTEETVRLWEIDTTSPRGKHLVALAEMYRVEASELSGEPAEVRVVREDVYPTLLEFLESIRGLKEDEVAHLRGQKHSSGDPGRVDPDYWASKLAEYRRHERLAALAHGRSERPSLPPEQPLDTGRTLTKKKQRPKDGH